MLNINEIKDLVLSMGEKIGLDKGSKLYPMFSKDKYVFSEGVSVYVDDEAYHFVAMERGKVVVQHDSTDVNDILYYVFKEITSTLATRYEVKHRKEDEDCRRGWWKEQLRLLEMINPQFARICYQEINQILKNYPFQDGKEEGLF